MLSSFPTSKDTRKKNDANNIRIRELPDSGRGRSGKTVTKGSTTKAVFFPGFGGVDNLPCILCNRTFFNYCTVMVPLKLRHHFETSQILKERELNI